MAFRIWRRQRRPLGGRFATLKALLARASRWVRNWARTWLGRLGLLLRPARLPSRDDDIDKALFHQAGSGMLALEPRKAPGAVALSAAMIPVMPSSFGGSRQDYPISHVSTLDRIATGEESGRVLKLGPNFIRPDDSEPQVLTAASTTPSPQESDSGANANTIQDGAQLLDGSAVLRSPLDDAGAAPGRPGLGGEEKPSDESDGGGDGQQGPPAQELETGSGGSGGAPLGSGDNLNDLSAALASLNFSIGPQFSSGTSAGGTFAGGTTSSLMLSSAGLVIVESNGDTTVVEGGATDTISISLASQPTSIVAVRLDPGSQLALSREYLFFTPANYSVAQDVTITGVNDGAIEGNHSGQISFSVYSGDPAYNQLTTSPLSVSVNDPTVAVTGILTADNHYGLYYGKVDGQGLNFVGRNEFGTAGNPGQYNWSLPETWNFDVVSDDRLYVVGWDGTGGGPQMWIGQFDVGGQALLSDLDNWEYFVSTGTSPGDTGAAPSIAALQADIQQATWAKPQASAANGSSPWGTIPGINTNADFVWHDTLAASSSSDGHYVIFRTTGPVQALNNRAPTPQDDYATTNEDVPLDIDTGDLLGNDTDPNNQPLVVVGVSATSSQGGTVAFSDNGTPNDTFDDFVTYTPPTNFFGTDTFTYQVSDIYGSTASATVRIDVASNNDNLVATLTADNHYRLFYGPGSGSVVLEDVGRNEFTSTGNPGQHNWSLPETFSFEPGAGDHLYLAAWNDQLTQMFIGQFELPGGGTLLSNDVQWEYTIAQGMNPGVSGDLTAAQVAAEVNAAAGWARPMDTAPQGTQPWGVIAGIDPAALFVWHDTFDEDSSSSDPYYVILRTVLPVVPSDRPPVAGDDSYTTHEDTPLSITTASLLQNDVDPEMQPLTFLSFSATSINGGTVALNDNGTPGNPSDDFLVYTPPADFYGTDSFTYKIQDAYGWQDEAKVSIVVTSNNDDFIGTITADNHYRLFYGSTTYSDVGRNEFGTAGNPGQSNWSLPETWSFEPGTNDHIYVAAWDDGGPQMWIGQFQRPNGSYLYSSANDWEYYVTTITNPGSSGDVSVAQLAAVIPTAVWSSPPVTLPNGSSPWNTIPGLSTSADFVWHDTFAATSSSDAYVVLFRTKAPAGYTGTITGQKYEDLDGDGVRDPIDDDGGVANWTIYLKDVNDNLLQTTTTKADGTYQFTGLAPGTYWVEEQVQSGWTATTDTRQQVTITASSVGDFITGIDFGNFQHYTISGRKFDDTDGDGFDSSDPVLEDWTIELVKPDGSVLSTTTNSQGIYQFTDVGLGTYTVREVLQSGWTQTHPGSGTYTVSSLSGQEVQDRDFANFKLVTLAGIKFKDVDGDGTQASSGEPGVQGWTIGLDEDNDLVPDRYAYTDSTGYYAFTDLGPGTYNVIELPQVGWTQTAPLSPDYYTITVQSGVDHTDLDFGNQQTATITGRKYDTETLAGLSGWTIYIDQDFDDEYDVGEPTTTTGAQGDYAFTVGTGTYRIREIPQAGWRQLTTNPSDIVVSASGQTFSNVDFGNFQDKIIPTTLNVEAQPITAVEGDAFNDTVASFTSADASLTAGDFSATIDWGDNGSSAGTITSDGMGGFLITGTHTYDEGQPYLVAVTVTGPHGVQETVYTTAMVDDAALSLTGTTLASVTEGVALTNVTVATFTDSDPDAASKTYQAFVDWGDGTSIDTINVNGAAGPVDIEASHTYADAGHYTVRVILEDETLQRAVTTSIIDVTPTSAPTGPVFVDAMRLQGTEGTQLQDVVVALGSNLDPMQGPSCHEALIDWGDGTTSQGRIVPTQLNGFEIRGTHTYQQQGNYLVTVTLTDEMNRSATAYSTATMDDESFSPTARNVPVAVQVAFSDIVLGSFNDAFLNDSAGQYTVEINWGDGSTTSTGQVLGSGGDFFVSGSHTYSLEGNFLASATIKGDGVTFTTLLTPVSVGTVLEGSSAQRTVASFYDTNPNNQASDYAGTVDWGDTQSTSIATSDLTSIDTQAYSVSGTHTWDAAGTYVVQVDVNAGVTVMTPSSFRSFLVADAPLQAQSAATHNGTEGQLASNIQVATFSDSDPALNSSFTATIDWGDGTRSTGTVNSLGSGNYEVLGSHTWQRLGSYTITVFIESNSGGSTITTTQASIADAGLTAQGIDVAAFAGISTGSVVVAQVLDANSFGQPEELTGTIFWGDGNDSPATFRLNSSGVYDVLGEHTYASTGSFTITTEIDYQSLPLATVMSSADVDTGSVTGVQRGYDPERGYQLALGEATVSLNTGGLRLEHELDFDMSPGTDVGGNPALAYNSNTVDVRPIIEIQLSPEQLRGQPESIDVELVFAGQVQQTVTFVPDDFVAGDPYVMAVQVAQAVSGSGVYDWTANIKIHYTGSTTPVSLAASGQALVVAQDDSPYGAGWGIRGVDRLVFGCEYILYAYGTGDSRLFTFNSGTNRYESMEEDWGELEHFANNPTDFTDDTYTYTDKFQMKWNFDSRGLLTSIVDTYNLALSYQYDTQGRLTQVDAPDGGTTTLQYSPSSVTIFEPSLGQRAIELTISGGDLTAIQENGETNRTFEYSGHRLTRDQWDPLDAQFSYDSAGLLNQVNRGLGAVYQITAMAGVGLQEDPTYRLSEVLARVTDPLSNSTTYRLDERGRLLEQNRPLGISESWQRDSHGQVTVYSDPLSHLTTYTYDNTSTGKGDRTRIDYADGSFETFQYDATFHKLTQSTDRRGYSTTFLLNTQGDVTQTIDPNSHSSYTFYDARGNVTGTMDAKLNLTQMVYDASDRLTQTIDANNHSTLISYDDNGNERERVNALGDSSFTFADIHGRVTVSIDENGGTRQTLYSASGRVTQTIDAKGNSSETLYDQHGNVTATIDALGKVSKTFYDLTDNVTGTMDPEGNEAKSFYDEAGRVTGTLDENGDLSRTLYDLASNVTATITPQNNQTSTFYDVMGRVTGVQDANLNLTTTYYDPNGNVTGTRDALMQLSKTHYDPAGLVTGTEDELNRLTQTLYDETNLVTGVIDPASNLVNATYYDAAGQVTGTHDAIGNLSQTFFDAVGRVTGTMDPLLRLSKTYFDAAGNVTGTADPLNNLTKFLRDAEGLVTDTVNALNNASRYLFDEEGRVTGAIDPMQLVTKLLYDDNGQVTGSIDHLGLVNEILYDESGRVTSTRDAFGRIDYTLYDSEGNITGTIDIFGRLTKYIFDKVGQQTASVDANNQMTQTLYDAVGRVTANVDEAGVLSQMFYDVAGQLTAVADTVNGLTQFFYDLNGRVTATLDANGGLSKNFYDLNGRVTATADQLGNIRQSLYDAAGQLTGTVDPLGRLTQLIYDGASRVTGIVDALGQFDRLFYDAIGQITGSMDSLGRLYQTFYNVGGLVTLTIDPLGRQTHFTYNNLAQLTQTQDSAGNLKKSFYDQMGQVTGSLDQLGNLTRMFYDNAGNLTGTLDNINRLTQTLYDANGFVTAEVDPGGHVTLTYYDLLGQVTGVLDPNGGLTQSLYDLVGRLTGVIDPHGCLTRTLYDEVGQVTGTVDGNGGLSQFLYDFRGLVTGVIDPEGHLTQTAYDLAGRATMTVDALGQAAFTYFDESGQVTGTVDRLGRTEQTFYDLAGRVTGMIDAGGHETRLFYDIAGQLTGTIDALGNTTETYYDLGGQVTGLVDELGRLTQSFYDLRGLLTGVLDPLNRLKKNFYDEAGRLTGTLDPLNQLTQTVYDKAGRVTGVVDPLGNTWRTYYDPDNLIISTQDPLGRLNITFFDGNHQVTGTLDPQGRFNRFFYDLAGHATGSLDALGNLTRMFYDCNDQVTGVLDPLNRLTSTFYDSDGNVTGVMDPLGRLTQTLYNANHWVTGTLDPGAHLTQVLFDAEGQATGSIDALGRLSRNFFNLDGNLTGSLDPLGALVQNLYDANHRLTGTIDPLGNESRTLYDAASQVTGAVDALGYLSTTYYDNAGQATGSVDRLGNLTQVLFDNAGRVTGMIDAANFLSRTFYDAAGRVTGTMDELGNIERTLFDAAGQVTGSIDRLNNLTRTFYNLSGEVTGTLDSLEHLGLTFYDANGRVTGTMDSLGRRNRTLFDAAGQMTGSIDGLDHLTRMLYDAAGQATGVIDPLGELYRTFYDADGNVTGTMDPLGRVSKTLFDANHQATGTIDPLGHLRQTFYDEAGQVTGTTDALGNLTSTLYDFAGRVTANVAPGNRLTQFLFDAAGQVTGTIDPLNRLSQSFYDAEGRLTGSVDPLGNSTETLLDVRGLVTGMIDQTGELWRTFYDAAGQATGSADPLNGLAQTLYDANGQVTGTIDPAGRTKQTLFDSAGQITGTVDGLGNLTQSLFDSAGQLVSYVDPLNRINLSFYDNAGQLTSSIDALGRVRDILYDAGGRVTGTLEPGNRLFQMLYDEAGQATGSIDPLDRLSQTLYDDNGRVTGTMDALGSLAQNLYDDEGRVTGTIDVLNNLTQTFYDEVGQVTATIDALSQEAQNYFDLAGQLTGTLDVAGQLTQMFYDAAGRITGVLDDDGNLDQTFYDAVGRVTGTVERFELTQTLYDAAGRATGVIDRFSTLTQNLYDASGLITGMIDRDNRLSQNLYDGAGRLTQTIDVLGRASKNLYDAAGQITGTINALNYLRQTFYDDLGRVTGTLDPLDNLQQSLYNEAGFVTGAIDPLGELTQTFYDLAGNVTLVIDPNGNETEFTYDDLNRKITHTDPRDFTATFLYDAAGRLTGSVDREERRREYTYDDLGRLTQEEWFDDANMLVDTRTFTYDPLGRMLTADNAAGTYTYTYDIENRVETQTDPNSLTLTFTYDVDDHQILVEDSEGGSMASIYDAYGRLESRRYDDPGGDDLRVDLAYTGTHQLESITRYTDLAGTTLGGTSASLYDAIDRVTGIIHKDALGNTLEDFSYTYDAADRLFTKTENTVTTSFGYDAASQLTADDTRNFSYDAGGNRDNNGYTYDTGNRITSDGTWDFTHDDEGNICPASVESGRTLCLG